ncbi:hypothetical protein PG996_009216 [Apiospora saccharicola]|uniref:Uncharacterized protein n=1 Tax=Apiospora saccharicola TaxID=335842 RepID=A0ABR1UMJ4_9PEZI
MEPITEQTLRDLQEDIENLENKVSILRDDYETTKATLETLHAKKKHASDELIAKSEADTLAIKATEEHLQRKKNERNLKTCIYYAEKYLSSRATLASGKSDNMTRGSRGKRSLPDDPALLVTMATQNDLAAGLITADGAVLFDNADIAKTAKHFGFTWVSVPSDVAAALDKTVALLINQSIEPTLYESITHCPKQMDRIPAGAAPKNRHKVMDPLIMSLRNIQHDTIVLGGAILAIIDGKMCEGTIADLVNSLERTHHMHELREIYGTQDDNQNGDAIETIVRGLASSDVLAQKSIRLRLLHHVVVLAKYTCLGTGLAGALAPKLGRGEGGRQDAERQTPIADKTLGRCLECHGELHRMYVTEIAEGPQLPNVPRAAIAYNKDGKVGGIFTDGLIKGRLAKLGQELNRDLLKFLGSVGEGYD